MKTIIKFTLPASVASDLREHDNIVRALLGEAEAVTASMDDNEAEFSRLSREILADEGALDPKDSKAATALAAKRESRDALARRIREQDAARPGAVLEQSLVREMNNGSGAIRKAAMFAMDAFTAPIEKAIAPYCISEANTKGCAHTPPAVGQFGRRFHAPTLVAISGFGVVRQRLGLIKTLLSGEVEFEFQGTCN